MNRNHKRILIYSHDSFGLGHIRRCRTIANGFVDRFPNISVLIITGSPIAGSFEFQPRVDYVRLPGVIKLQDGEYKSLSLDMDIKEVIQLRSEIIFHTALAFRPNILLVDKEPLGLRGEIKNTLTALKSCGTKLILGLRDILDDPEKLKQEWQRKRVFPALEKDYDKIWIYGKRELIDPFEGLDLSKSIHLKTAYTGYIERKKPRITSNDDQPFLLVTPGGGGDGAILIKHLLALYKKEAANLPLMKIVLGPFMAKEDADKFTQYAADLPNVEIMSFSAQIEELMINTTAIIAMGGYNTFCEIMSYNKPAALFPRTEPRKEQLIRVNMAEKSGLVKKISPAVLQDYDALKNLIVEIMQPSMQSLNNEHLFGGIEFMNQKISEMLFN
jgi:predicted glycosyltransferase